MLFRAQPPKYRRLESNLTSLREAKTQRKTTKKREETMNLVLFGFKEPFMIMRILF